jgi:glyoxylase-like metal-dependent hydrolase (beta-lactamase superfamily II)
VSLVSLKVPPEPINPSDSTVLERAQSVNATFEVLADVPELLTSASIPLSSIDSIIWSHHHVDHTGDVSLFPKTTSLVVGPGFKTNPKLYPGSPLNPDAYVPQAAFAGRDVIEVDFNSTTDALKLAGLRAIDWFDDGSLYFLEAPGHCPEYIMALARTSPDKFVLLAGDIASHPGVIRPSPLCPLPESIPLNSSSRTTPFFEVKPYFMRDPVAGRKTLAALQEFDASEHVLVVLDHDTS